MPEDFKYDVFLSHSSKDEAVVRPIAKWLKKDALRVWFDDAPVKGSLEQLLYINWLRADREGQDTVPVLHLVNEEVGAGWNEIRPMRFTSVVWRRFPQEISSLWTS